MEKLTLQEQMEETLFLGLRLTDGVKSEVFFENFGQSLEEVYGDVIAGNLKDGLLCWDGRRLSLTERGLDVSNYVMAQFLL